MLIVAAALLVLSGCGQKTQPGTSQPPAIVSGSEASASYTVAASELKNPENKPVYLCPMHRDQVSLNPEARCSICRMRLVPQEESK